jgi:hypothetical protein
MNGRALDQVSEQNSRGFISVVDVEQKYQENGKNLEEFLTGMMSEQEEQTWYYI